MFKFHNLRQSSDGSLDESIENAVSINTNTVRGAINS